MQGVVTRPRRNHAALRIVNPVPNFSPLVGDGVLDVPDGRKIIAHLQTITPYDQPWNKSHYGICVICPRNGQDRSLQIVFRAVANDLCSSPAE